MWKVVTLVLVVASLVASQSLADYKDLQYNDLKRMIVNNEFIQELLSCSSCTKTDCRDLVKAVMNDVSTVLGGGCPGCKGNQRELAMNISLEVQQSFTEEYAQLVTLLSNGPVKC